MPEHAELSEPRRIYLIGEMYRPLEPWLIKDESPRGMPAVYNLFLYLGHHKYYTFYSLIYNREVNRTINFPNGSVIELRKLWFPNYLIWKLLVFLILYFGHHPALRNSNFDLVYGLSTFSIIARQLGIKYKVKSVGRIYGTILTRLVKEKKYFKLYTRHIFELLNIRFTPDIVIATKDGTLYNEVSEYFSSKKTPVMMYNGMNRGIRKQLLSYHPVGHLPKKDTINICQIARLQKYKRPEISIEIVSLLVHEYHIKNVKLSIVGSGPLKIPLEKLIKKKKLEPYVDIIDEMSRGEIVRFIEYQHVANFYYEGGSLGNTFWECCLAGKLICTVDTGNTESIIKDGVSGIIKNDNTQLARRVAIELVGLIDMDISPITRNSRNKVKNLITAWKERFDKEFDLISKYNDPSI